MSVSPNHVSLQSGKERVPSVMAAPSSCVPAVQFESEGKENTGLEVLTRQIELVFGDRQEQTGRKNDNQDGLFKAQMRKIIFPRKMALPRRKKLCPVMVQSLK